MEKRLTFTDLLDARHSVGINRNHRASDKMAGGSTFTGEVIVRDQATGQVLFRKKNLIVLRGRTFALEALFADGIETFGGPGYVSDITRKLCSFYIGSGGAPGGDPFNPYVPSPTDLALGTAIPFRLHDTAQSGSGNPLLFIPNIDIGNYGGAASVVGQPTQTKYFLKHFDVRDPVWVWSSGSNEVYKKVQLSINAFDARTGVSNIVSELALVMGRINGLDVNQGQIFTNPEIFSRITFATEFMSADKSLAIEYRVYA